MKLDICIERVQGGDSPARCINLTQGLIGSEITQSKSLFDFYAKFSKLAQVDTGLIPLDGSGLLSYRQAGSNAQYVYQVAPRSHLVTWGRYENDADADTLELAFPYYVIIAETENDFLIGARHFFSPDPIFSLKQPLYHTPLPNTNCCGYSGTSVGWICLYPRDSWSGMTMGEQIDALLQRVFGGEAYNEINMEKVDGQYLYRTLYSSRSGHDFFNLDKYDWEEKTHAEGVDWTLDPNLWIPVRCNPNLQSSHDARRKILTLEDAMTKGIPRYSYQDDGIRFYNEIASEITSDEELDRRIARMLLHAAGAAKSIDTDTAPAQDPLLKGIEGASKDVLIHSVESLQANLGANTEYPGTVTDPQGNPFPSWIHHIPVGGGSIPSEAITSQWIEKDGQWIRYDYLPFKPEIDNNAT
jgi:hypothetical protein